MLRLLLHGRALPQLLSVVHLVLLPAPRVLLLLMGLRQDALGPQLLDLPVLATATSRRRESDFTFDLLRAVPSTYFDRRSSSCHATPGVPQHVLTHEREGALAHKRRSNRRRCSFGRRILEAA